MDLVKNITKNRSNLFIAIGVVLLGVFQTFFTINEKQTAIVIQFGKVRRVISGAGLNVKVPFLQSIIKFDVRILDFDGNTSEVIASDQRRLLVDAFAKYKIIDPVKVFETSRNERGVEARLESILDSTIRQVLGGITLQDMLTNKREEVMETIQHIANTQAQNFGIEIVDVRIKRTDLPLENSEAIYKRMKSEREKEAREYRAEGEGEYAKILATADRIYQETIANANKKAEITKGEADSKAIAIFAKAYGVDEDFFSFYSTIQSHKENTKDKKIIVDFSNQYFKYLNSSSSISNSGGAKK